MPGGVTEGRSLAEWTATSARPSSTATSTSLVKTPWPPIRSRGWSASRSPSVRTTTSSTSVPGAAALIDVETISAWSRASGEPRVANRTTPRARTPVRPAGHG